MRGRHGRRFTRKGVQCDCGSPTWSYRHIIKYEMSYLLERLGIIR